VGVGVHRLLFSTDLPFVVPESPIMELATARPQREEDAAVETGSLPWGTRHSVWVTQAE
jgi:hypothetical protein